MKEIFWDYKREWNLQKSTSIFCDNFMELLETANEETLQDVIRFLTRTIQGEIFIECLKNNQNSPQYTTNIMNSLLLDLRDSSYYHPCQIKVNISTTPVISCLWNVKRVKENICEIGTCNQNPFNGEHYSWNIEAYLIEPAGVVLVHNGNHSVNAAIIHEEGEIIVKTIVDISPLLERYRFDGKNYINKETGMKLEDCFTENKTGAFMYTLGLLFEVTRLLYEKRKK